MKQNIALSIFALLFAVPLSAQTAQDNLMKTMVKETCQEIVKVDFSNKTANEVQLGLGLALVSVAGKHQEELKTFGFEISDPPAMKKLGETLGMMMIANCPEFLKAVTANPNTLKDIAALGNKGGTSGTISGTLVSIVGGDFSYLVVEDDKGKMEKLWWMEYFDGSNALAADPQKQLKKPIKVSYLEKEVFNSTLKDYVKIKVITRVE